MKIRVPPPVPDLPAFKGFFWGLFGSGASIPKPEELVVQLDVAEIPEFMVVKV